MPKKLNKVFIIFLLALIIRLVFLYPQFSGDVKNHFAWGNGFLDSPLGFYSRHFPGFNDPNYPPITIILFAVSNFLLISVNSFFTLLNNLIPAFPSFLVPLFSSENMQMGFLKLPAIFADLGIGLLLLKIFEKRKEKHALFLTSLFLFDPAIIYISSVWGQVESLTIFFLLLSLYGILMGGKNKYSSILFFTLAALTKQTALWFLPFYIFLWAKEIGFKDWLKGSALGLAAFTLSYLPFGLNPIRAFSNYLSTLSGSSDVVADAAWNVWYFLFPAGTPDSVVLGLFSVRQISIVLLGLILSLQLYSLIKRYSIERFLFSLFFWSLVVFFIQTRVHERHLAPSIVFLLLTPNLFSRYLLDLLLLSSYHFYNLYSVLRLPFI